MPVCVPYHTASVLGLGVFSQLRVGRPEGSRTPGLEIKSIYVKGETELGVIVYAWKEG